MATYVNDLRLKEISTGDESGTWGTSTNTNLELIGEALGYATEQSFGSDADATTTVADGVSDPARAMYFKVTSAGNLTATRTLTIAPNTVSRVMFIENATSGSQSIAISQGSGANVTIATGKTAIVYLDGAGSGAAVVDAMAGVDPGVTDTLAEVLTAGNATGGTDIAVGTGDDITFADSSKAIFGAGSDLQIYSDGDSSYLKENSATGSLFVDGDNIRFRTSDGSKSYALFTNSGSARLYHDNSIKIETTSTGIDVTGTATMDELTVDSTTGFSWLPVSTAGAKVGAIGTGTGLIINTPSVNASFGSGLAIDGSYASDLSSVNVKAFGPKFSSYGSELNLFTSDDTSLLKRQTIASNGDISFYEDTGTTPKLFWDASAESLGIGTSSPSSYHSPADNLVIGSSGDNGLTIVSGTSSGGTICFADGTSGGAQFAGFIDYQHNGDYMRFGTNVGTERLRILADGSVIQGNTVSLVASNFNNQAGAAWHNPDGHYEIATTGNIAALEIGKNNANDGTLVVFRKQTSVVGSINNFSSTEFGLVSEKNLVLTQNTTTERNLVFSSSYFGSFGADDATIDLGRSVGRWKDLYLANDIAHLDTAGNARLLYDRSSNLLGNAGTNLSCASALVGSSGASFGELMTVNSNGASYSAHLFATSGATAPLICRNQNGVSGSRSQIIFYYDSSAVGSITSTASATGYGTSSDQRLKSNIEDADDAGSKVDAIQVRKFDWKVDGSHQDYGMVAQELQAVAPEAVQAPEDPDEMMAVDYSKLVPMLVKEIQSLRARVQQLEND